LKQLHPYLYFVTVTEGLKVLYFASTSGPFGLSLHIHNNNTATHSALTLHMHIVVNAVSTRVNASKFPPSVCHLLYLFFTLACFAPITSHVTGTKEHIAFQVAYAKGHIECYISPISTLKMCPIHV
jgi:hypothetical protein